MSGLIDPTDWVVSSVQHCGPTPADNHPADECPGGEHWPCSSHVPQVEDGEHDCQPPFCDHPSHEDEEPPNDDWIHDAYERQARDE